MLALLLAIALVRTPLVAQPAGPAWSALPAAGTVTSPYGKDAGRWHHGIDIGILRSLAVRAAEPGRVIAVGKRRGFEGYGNVVQVSLGRGYTALYAHLAGWRVRVGDRIEAGQRIGTAGCTGSCTGPHLHFELRLHGVPVNPMRFRQQEGPAEPSLVFGVG
ncbi:MAG TPA: M23 family metallopeptidase [Gaiellaceae bacterium]|nr:M23 family metallopeptidase [Gaiellaceae bacterium]